MRNLAEIETGLKFLYFNLFYFRLRFIIIIINVVLVLVLINFNNPALDKTDLNCQMSIF